jgi:hypothetical protein
MNDEAVETLEKWLARMAKEFPNGSIHEEGVRGGIRHQWFVDGALKGEFFEPKALA